MKEGLFEQLLLHLFENGLRDDLVDADEHVPHRLARQLDAMTHKDSLQPISRRWSLYFATAT